MKKKKEECDVAEGLKGNLKTYILFLSYFKQSALKYQWYFIKILSTKRFVIFLCIFFYTLKLKDGRMDGASGRRDTSERLRPGHQGLEPGWRGMAWGGGYGPDGSTKTQKQLWPVFQASFAGQWNTPNNDNSFSLCEFSCLASLLHLEVLSWIQLPWLRWPRHSPHVVLPVRFLHTVATSKHCSRADTLCITFAGIPLAKINHSVRGEYTSERWCDSPGAMTPTIYHHNTKIIKVVMYSHRLRKRAACKNQQPQGRINQIKQLKNKVG